MDTLLIEGERVHSSGSEGLYHNDFTMTFPAVAHDIQQERNSFTTDVMCNRTPDFTVGALSEGRDKKSVVGSEGDLPTHRRKMSQRYVALMSTDPNMTGNPNLKNCQKEIG